MGTVEGWEEINDGSALHRRFTFANFTESLAFVNKVGVLAEVANHHPDILFGWGYTTLTLTTHDAGKVITDKDTALASAINEIKIVIPDKRSVDRADPGSTG